MYCILNLALLALMGCGGSGKLKFGYGDEDADAIANSISVLADFADRPERLNPLFVKAPDAATREKLGSHTFATVEMPDVHGDKATARVEVRDFSEKVLGVVQWTAVKQDGKWKLKDTPFP